jgi:cytochrome c oxidase subunit II
MQKQVVLVTAFAGLLMASYFVAHAQSSGNEKAPPQIIEVSAKKYEFTPAEIHVKVGARVELKVHSEDETHGLKLDAFPEGSKDKSKPGLLFDPPNENGKVTKGVDQVVDFVAQEPGTYDFKCAKVCGLGHGHMKGKLIVDE